MIFHVLNRGNARDRIFDGDGGFAAFEKVLAETQSEVFVRILSYCLMPNHWHLVLWPLKDGDLGRFMQRLTTTHVRRWHLHHHTVGTGHLYQGTYKSFPIEEDDHLYTVLRYVERNPVRGSEQRGQVHIIYGPVPFASSAPSRSGQRFWKPRLPSSARQTARFRSQQLETEMLP